MNQNNIEHLAQGFPPSHIGKDHEEVVIELAKHALELQQKLDAVLAESVVKSDVIERLIGQYSMAGYHAVQNSLNPAESLLYDAMQAQKSPATDAHRNSVRAEGVEVLAENHQRIVDSLDGDSLFADGERKHAAIAAAAVHFAAQLRAETDTTPSQYESLAGGK